MAVDLKKAAADLARYQRAAEEWRAWADTLNGAERQEALRKSLVYQGNCAKIERATDGMLKAFPVKKRIPWQKMSISVEHPAGSIRKWRDDTCGEEGSTYMMYDYGYLRATEGVDGDAVDVFVGPDLEGASCVYVVRQLRAPDFRFYDEDKCMVGFSDAEHARNAYLAHYNRPEFLGRIETFAVADFVAAVKKTKKAPAPVGGWQTLMLPQRLEDSPLLSDEVRLFVSEAQEEPELMSPALSQTVKQFKYPVANDSYHASADAILGDLLPSPGGLW